MDASTLALSKVHRDWLDLFPNEFKKAAQILNALENYTPNTEDVFKAFEISPKEVRVVIVGQDPYPTKGDAIGLAFSVKRSEKLPKSLINIFKELKSDLGIARVNGDLSDWQSQGVFLINRVLTTPIGATMGHKQIGWEDFTETIISYLGQNGAIGLLMGKEAETMAQHFNKKVITSHPSPLSAYRGFFGSKPFSRINELLEIPIKW